MVVVVVAPAVTAGKNQIYLQLMCLICVRFIRQGYNPSIYPTWCKCCKALGVAFSYSIISIVVKQICCSYKIGDCSKVEWGWEGFHLYWNSKGCVLEPLSLIQSRNRECGTRKIFISNGTSISHYFIVIVAMLRCQLAPIHSILSLFGSRHQKCKKLYLK